MCVDCLMSITSRFFAGLILHTCGKFCLIKWKSWRKERNYAFNKPDKSNPVDVVVLAMHQLRDDTGDQKTNESASKELGHNTSAIVADAVVHKDGNDTE